MEPEKFIGQMTKLINVILPRNSEVEDQEVPFARAAAAAAEVGGWSRFRSL